MTPPTLLRWHRKLAARHCTYRQKQGCKCCIMGFVEQPPVTDHRAIIDAVRRHGSVHYPMSAVPGEFRIWRRRLRQLARAADLRISVTRTAGYVLVEAPDYEVSDDDALATADVIGAQLLGQVLSFDDALCARRRQRMRLAAPLSIVRDDGDR